MSTIRSLIFLLLFPFVLNAQRWEIGFQMGASNYQGDLAPDIILSESHLSGGIFLKKNVNQFFSHTFLLNESLISGDDKNFNSLKARNLSFQTYITEFSYRFEFNFFPFSFGLHPQSFTPYVFIGLSGFKYEPKALYNGTLVKLNPLDTEGKLVSDEKKYKYLLYQLAIPIGGGFKFLLNDNLVLGINVSFSSAFTDYLDDVSTTYYDHTILEERNGQLSAALSDRSDEVLSQSIGYLGKQRGRSDLKDWYIVAGIALSYKIKNAACYEF
jgi:hypothetical protein